MVRSDHFWRGPIALQYMIRCTFSAQRRPCPKRLHLPWLPRVPRVLVSRFPGIPGLPGVPFTGSWKPRDMSPRINSLTVKFSGLQNSHDLLWNLVARCSQLPSPIKHGVKRVNINPESTWLSGWPIPPNGSEWNIGHGVEVKFNKPVRSTPLAT